MSQCQGRTSYGRLLTASSFIILVSLVVQPVFAANRQAQEKAARKACLNGDYAKGVEILSDLFVETKDPTYIYNQGRCFEQNRKYEDALARFEEFLAAAENTRKKPEDVAEAEKHIAGCKELIAEQNAKAAAAARPLAPQPAPQPASNPAPEHRAQPAPVIIVEPAPTEPANRGKGLLVGGIVTASVGAAAVGLGVFLNLKANRMVNDMETKVGDYSSGKDSDRKTYQALSWVGYGLGAACLVTGGILIGFGATRGGGGSSNVALVPTVGNGHAGFMLSGGY